MKRWILVASLALAGPLAAQTPDNTTNGGPETKIPENMVLVPAGEFSMGTNRDDGTDFNQRDNTPLAANDARPAHTVNVSAFYIDKTEVTNAQYKKFCDATGLQPPPHWKNGTYPDGQANYPVARVNWYEADAYAKWIGKRLPTEAEWEKTARGTDAREFPWGGGLNGDRVGGESGPHDVGIFPSGSSPYGALDMAGNVAEWTSDWFDGYPGSPTKQVGFGQKIYKVARGGAWYGLDMLGKTWYREICRPAQRSMWIGFRCAKDVN